MRKTQAFRPLSIDGLEDRVVLSPVVAAPRTAAVHNKHAAPSAQTIANKQVSDAYSIFVTNFTEAVNVDLYMPSVNGSASNTAFFSQQLGLELNILTKSVVKSLGSVPAGATAVTQVRQAINGSNPSSLRTRLSALALSSMRAGSAISSFEGTAIEMIQQNFIRVRKDVLASLPAPVSTPASTTT